MTRKQIEQYIGGIRNKAKRAYATDYFRYRTQGGPITNEPDRGFYTTNGHALSYMAAQAVRMRIDAILSQHCIDNGGIVGSFKA